MISVKTILLFFSAAPLAVYSLDCDDFTVGDCNESKDGLIESNDRVSLLTERRIYTGSLIFSIFRFQQKKFVSQLVRFWQSVLSFIFKHLMMEHFFVNITRKIKAKLIEPTINFISLPDLTPGPNV